MIALGLASCSFGIPTRLEGVGAPGCEAEGVDPARLMADVEHLASSPRRSDARRAEVRAWLGERLGALGFAVEERPFAVGKVTGTNVVATGPSGGTVWVGAHYDTVGDTPGADDNASGVAAALELARVLGPDAPVRYVFFDAEEPHSASVGADGRNFAFGSQAFVDALGPGEATSAWILETIGFACDTCQRLPPGVPKGIIKVDGHAAYWVTEHPSTLAWADRVATAAIAAGPEHPMLGIGVPDRGAGLPYSRFSDHAPFWDIGVPAVMVTDTAMLRNTRYHQPGDTADQLVPAFLTATTRGVAAALNAEVGRCR